MPLLLEQATPGTGRPAATEPALSVGLVNLMPDAAFAATERQFASLLAAAAGTLDVRLHLFALPEIPRGTAVRDAMSGRYGDLAALEAARLDALIVTGAEPLTARLEDEAYWPALTRIVDWAEHNTASTLWSCLAAHAAVQHLDGIVRVPMLRKRFGLFDCVPASEDALLAGAPAAIRVPHSRWNDLDESALRRHGYRIVSRSLEAGIDTFVKRWRSRFVFLQGHPEYEPDTLHREFRRDARRYLAGERESPPDLPRHYYDRPTERRLLSFLDEAGRSRDPETWARFPAGCVVRPGLAAGWRASATRLYANWLASIVEAVP